MKKNTIILLIVAFLMLPSLALAESSVGRYQLFQGKYTSFENDGIREHNDRTKLLKISPVLR